MKTISENKVTLDKFSSYNEKMKIIYQWVKQDHISLKDFMTLIDYINGK